MPDVPGITTFRGNLTRSYYGEGPVPRRPRILWRFPSSGGLCSPSTDETGTHQWCGVGWTGQPNVIPKGGKLELRFGAYDSNYHFLNARTGRQLREDFVTGDLAKGSATSDPDGYPLYYAGSRDNRFRIVALDRGKPTELWSLDADTSVPDPTWNNDWDGAALVVGDYLIEGGENSWLYVIKLNRGWTRAGKVRVRPRVVLTVPSWDDGWRPSRRTGTSRSRTPWPSMTASCTSPTPPGSCRAGTSHACCAAAGTPSECSASGPATTPTRRS